MNSEEIKEYVKSLPEEVRVNFNKKEFLNQKIVTEKSIEDFFETSKTVAQLKELLSQFNDDDIVNVSAILDSGYYEGEERAYLEANVVENKLETDEELTNRIKSKIISVEKDLSKKKKRKL